MRRPPRPDAVALGLVLASGCPHPAPPATPSYAEPQLLAALDALCAEPKEACTLDLRAVVPSDWDRAVIINDVVPSVFTEDLGVDGLGEYVTRTHRAVSMGLHVILLIRGREIVWDAWGDCGVDREYRCFYFDPHFYGARSISRDEAVFGARRDEAESFVLVPAGHR